MPAADRNVNGRKECDEKKKKGANEAPMSKGKEVQKLFRREKGTVFPAPR
jgi:hypothetical protein